MKTIKSLIFASVMAVSGASFAGGPCQISAMCQGGNAANGPCQLTAMCQGG
jgi:hypothetical protein